MSELIYGLVTGSLFGYLLQKGRVVRYDKQVGALRLQDMTILKFMLSAIIVAMIGIHALREFGLVEFRMRPLMIGPNIIGGLIFGLGWGMLGYCPGTAWGALGEGRWDAFIGLLGMFFGAAVYAEIYPLLQNNVLSWGVTDIYTLPELLHINQWAIIVAFGIGLFFLFRWFEK
jgi:uncharacterized membrane protein YedE/YeeE